jgi:hypothetical protein
MPGNMSKAIYGSWTGILNGSLSAGMKVDLRRMIAIFCASGMCG